MFSHLDAREEPFLTGNEKLILRYFTLFLFFSGSFWPLILSWKLLVCNKNVILIFFFSPFASFLFFVSALVVYCTKSRRAERYWQKTLLQMEEMESQIREEIRKGVFGRTQSQFTLFCVDWHEKRACETPQILTSHICLFVYVFVCVSNLLWRLLHLKREGDTTVDRFVPSKRDS